MAAIERKSAEVALPPAIEMRFQGAAHALVPKKDAGLMFWICGVPGSESIVKVKAPRAMVPGIRRLGMPPWRNISAASLRCFRSMFMICIYISNS